MSAHIAPRIEATIPEMREALEPPKPPNRNWVLHPSANSLPIRRPPVLFETPPGHRKDMSHLRQSGLLPAREGVNGNSTKSGVVMEVVTQPLELPRVFFREFFGRRIWGISLVRIERVNP